MTKCDAKIMHSDTREYKRQTLVRANLPNDKFSEKIQSNVLPADTHSFELEEVYAALDGGYAWIILVGAFLLQALTIGQTLCLTVLTVEWIEILGYPVEVTLWAGSLFIAIMFGTGPVASVLFKRFGARSVVIAGSLLATTGILLSAYVRNIYLVWLTYGVVGGFGCGMMFIPTYNIVAQYFKKRRPIAMGITASGAGFGAITLGPLLRYLLDEYGLQGAKMILAGIVLHGVLLGCLLRPIHMSNKHNFIVKQRILKTNSGCADLFDSSLFKTCKLWIFFINFILLNFGISLILVVITDYAKQVGIDKTTAAYLVVIVGITNTAGRIVSAAFASIRFINSLAIYTITNILDGIAILLFPCFETFQGFAVLCGICGAMYGAQIGVLGTVFADHYGTAKLPMALGFTLQGNGFGALLVPTVAGGLYAVFHNYEMPFYFAGSMTVFSGMLLFAIPILDRFKGKPKYIVDEIDVNIS